MEKIKWFLYVSATLVITIPILINLMSERTFSSTFSNIVIFSAIFMIICGKLITVLQKKALNKSFAVDVGVMLGLFVVVILRLN